MSLRFKPPTQHTRRYHNLTESDLLESETVLVASKATEARGCLPLWKSMIDQSSSRIISIEPINKDEIKVTHGRISNKVIKILDEEQLESLFPSDRILVDISGFPHHVWAPILQRAYKKGIDTRVMYAEPDSYTPHPTPASETMFDLSVGFDGLSPLPGFVQLFGPEDENKCLFLALLGFEGSRPIRLVSELENPTIKVIPVVGVPGFQLEFPRYTVTGNKTLFSDFHAHQDLHFVRASCPFEMFSMIKGLRERYPDYHFYIAPVGTKPHGLGAIWYAIMNPDNLEIMFDNPIRKDGRTGGIGIIHIYDCRYFNEI